jgi:alpha-D-ribose 1-methylphosphonate 5-triphosphate synthase subunit PhnH
MKDAALTGGFAEAPIEAAQGFRAALRAMAEPGTIYQVAGALPPAPLSVAAGVLLLTLCDGTTPLHLAGAADCAGVRDWVRFHCGSPLVSAEEAQFALGRWTDLQPVGRFAMGLPDYPDRSVTLIVEMAELLAEGAVLRGPGIEREARLSLPDVAAFQDNLARYPLGFDCFFTCGARLAALPRSTHVEAR